MTRKDFELIAGTLRYCDAHCDAHCDDETETETALVAWVAEKFADELAGTNARFDRARFIKACAVAS